MWRGYIVVYNDPSAQEFVEHAFRRHAHLTPADAHALMLAVHRFGVAIIAEGLTVEMAKIKTAIISDANASPSPFRLETSSWTSAPQAPQFWGVGGPSLQGEGAPSMSAAAPTPTPTRVTDLGAGTNPIKLGVIDVPE